MKRLAEQSASLFFGFTRIWGISNASLAHVRQREFTRVAGQNHGACWNVGVHEWASRCRSSHGRCSRLQPIWDTLLRCNAAVRERSGGTTSAAAQVLTPPRCMATIPGLDGYRSIRPSSGAARSTASRHTGRIVTEFRAGK